MRILYIHQYFATPNGTTGTRSFEFAKRWCRAGHHVTMLTTCAQLTSDDLRNAKGRFIKKFQVENIHVLAARIRYSQQMGKILRCFSFSAFLLFSSIFVLFRRKPDIVYATSTPLTVGVPAVIGRVFRGIPYVFEVRDQWPGIPIELGTIKNKLFKKILIWLEKTIYKNSSAIVALSPGMAEGIKDVTGNSKPITIVPNCSDLDVFRPDIEGSQIREKHGWDDKFVLLHFGAMGKANGLDFVVDATEKLADNKNIHFVLIGDGSEKERLAQSVKQKGLSNIEISNSVAKNRLPEVLAACDVAMVIFANYPILEHNSANKFFDSLAAGKPVLLNYSGWQKKILEENKAGFGCDLCNLDEFVENVSYLNSHRDKLAEMGRNARRVAVEMYNRDKLASEAFVVIDSVFDYKRPLQARKLVDSRDRRPEQ